MEEKEITKPQDKKLSYEQLEKAAVMLQSKLMEAEGKLKILDFTTIRLTWLFKVIENEMSFNSEFVTKCAEEITNLLTLEEPKENKEEKK